MNAPTPAAGATSEARAHGSGAVTALCVLLLGEAAFALAVTILLSLVAGEQRGAAETSTRFAAGGALLFAIAAYVAYRGARRRRSWSWTLGAVLQLILAIVAGIAMVAAGEEGSTAASLAAFALAGGTMVLLSTPAVRHALGQG